MNNIMDMFSSVIQFSGVHQVKIETNIVHT